MTEREKNLIDQLSTISCPVPGDHDKNMGDFLTRQINRFDRELPGGTHAVFGIVGLPGVGKSWVEKRLKELLDIRKPQIVQNGGLNIVSLTKDGMEPARPFLESGTTGVRSEKDFEFINFFLRRALVQSVRDYPLTIFTLTGVTAFKINRKLSGLDVGTKITYDIAGRRREFAGLPYRLCLMGLVAGDSLFQFTAQERWSTKHCQSLQEAREVARRFGKPIPQTPEEWQEQIINGASQEQLLLAYRTSADLAQHFVPMPAFALITTNPRIDSQIRILQIIRGQLGIRQDDFCIGLNSPDFSKIWANP